MKNLKILCLTFLLPSYWRKRPLVPFSYIGASIRLCLSFNEYPMLDKIRRPHPDPEKQLRNYYTFASAKTCRKNSTCNVLLGYAYHPHDCLPAQQFSALQPILLCLHAASGLLHTGQIRRRFQCRRAHRLYRGAAQ